MHVYACMVQCCAMQCSEFHADIMQIYSTENISNNPNSIHWSHKNHKFDNKKFRPKTWHLKREKFLFLHDSDYLFVET